MRRFQVLATDSANSEWIVVFVPRRTQAAVITWVDEIDFPMLALGCIEKGLNKVRGRRQPPRCWAFGDERPEGWPILHNGHVMGSIRWASPPSEDPDVWQEYMLAGLNYVDEHRGIRPPAPAMPRHLKAVC